ncbi:type II secretion system GspH family protein [Photobacterium sp. ZSDE20]|uniref:Type II secretion system GspH family protein n=1 Tax=Photobacterium pectinilyticum TaxID=2906793 RepID=A0ABT1N9G2_9GAMM|nr:type II secretion system protein [Photobacterium sp. ZSDE20]MCQ1061363.1 type II secretion system GspH family protein [Photobacterium sp. ZSDE20]MDD1830082.1 type II secretion system GspH family protein [Photobacterium sp. ZSDE20]
MNRVKQSGMTLIELMLAMCHGDSVADGLVQRFR